MLVDICYSGTTTYNTGVPMKIEEIPEGERLLAIKEFAEGSPGLEKCLITLNKLGIATKASCKGNHLQIVDNIPYVHAGAYIAFQEDSNWRVYLSLQIIEDKDVILSDDSIYYVGKDHEKFFEILNMDFLTGKKDNLRSFYMKKRGLTEELKEILFQKAYVICLIENGFTKKQIDKLLKYYILVTRLLNNLFKDINNKKISQKYSNVLKKYERILELYIKENLKFETKRKK